MSDWPATSMCWLPMPRCRPREPNWPTLRRQSAAAENALRLLVWQQSRTAGRKDAGAASPGRRYSRRPAGRGSADAPRCARRRAAPDRRQCQYRRSACGLPAAHPAHRRAGHRQPLAGGDCSMPAAVPGASTRCCVIRCSTPGAARAMPTWPRHARPSPSPSTKKVLQQAFREIADLLAAREHYAEQLSAQDAATKAQGERQRMVEARHTAGLVELPRTARRAARILRRATVGAGDTALAAREHRQPVQGPGPVLICPGTFVYPARLQRPLDRQRAADLAFAVARGLVVGIQLGSAWP
jgi:hypothetical protein